MSATVGWLFVGFVASVASASLLALTPVGFPLLVSGIAVTLAFEGWLISLAADLLRR